MDSAATETLCEHPILIASGNFTPLHQTPWAGTAIAQHYKRTLTGEPIGESWEFSCDPAAPSYIHTHLSLPQLLQAYPDRILFPHGSAPHSNTSHSPILVKLLHAALPLSVQVHPQDHDPFLTIHECGKPESWLVLQADPGCGLYIGFQHILDEHTLRTLLHNQQDLTPYLHFIPVQPGDYFEIAPGVIHAVGPGVVLLEPQRILPGKSGKTYRLWDWNRRYNARGELDLPHGQPRALHIEESLRLLNFKRLYAPNLMHEVRKTPVITTCHGLLWHTYPMNDSYQVHHMSLAAYTQTQPLRISAYGILICLKGDLTLEYAYKDITLKKQICIGQTMLIPWGVWPLTCKTHATHTECVWIHPAGFPLTRLHP
jgi:mannose-6-phosphate isomerase class I